MTGTGGPRIVQLSGEAAAGYAGRLLAVYGAEVIKVEPPGGAGYRCTGPWAGDRPGPDTGLLTLFLDNSKRSIVVDPQSETSRRDLDQLLGSADAVLCGHDAEDLAARHPHLVVASLTAYGLGAPDSGAGAWPILLEARAGWMFQIGEADGTPQRIRGELLTAATWGLWAAVGTLAALWGRQRGGSPNMVEVAGLEALVAANRYYETTYAQTGEVIGRCGSMLLPHLGYVEAADGWTVPCAASEPQTQHFKNLMHTTEVPDGEALSAWIAARGKEECFHAGQAAKIPWGYGATSAEVLALPQLTARKAFVEVDHAKVGRVRVPGLPARLRAEHAAVRPSPLLGADRLEDIAERPQPPQRVAPAGDGGGGQLPLQGIRVLEVTSWWAGPMAAAILADLGAEVIKVESDAKPDAWRTVLHDPTAPHPLETSPVFNSVNRNKLGVTIDLTGRDGRRRFLELAAEVDLLIENLQPHVLPKLGISYEELNAVNPRLIMISQSGFGQTGPWRSYGSLATVSESLAGIGLLAGEPDGPPMIAGQFPGDTQSSLHAAVAALVALHERERSGVGQHVDLAQLEATLPAAADALLDYQLNGRIWERIGNRHPAAAPHGCYPTRNHGEWLVLVVRDDEDWARLGEVINEDWATTPRFATSDGRLEHVEEIDTLVLGFTARFQRDELLQLLAAHGVLAAPVQSPPEVLADPHLMARRFFQMQHRDGVGTLPYSSIGVRFDGFPPPLRNPAPRLGQHNHLLLPPAEVQHASSLAG